MLMGMLRDAVRARPSKVAIVQGEARMTYEELLDRVTRAAGGLRALGVGHGDCVAAVLPNCPEFMVALLAAATLRAVFLPLNPNYTKGELSRFIADAKARVIVAGGGALAVCRAVASDGGAAIPIVVVGDSDSDAILFRDLSGPRDIAGTESFRGRALYLYTSGSTDTYKRVCCTQENLWFEARNFIDSAELTPDDTILCTIPLFHSYGIGNCLLDSLGLGATLVMPEQAVGGGDVPFVNQCRQVADLIRTESVRFYPGVPYQFGVLAGMPDDFPIDLSGVRLCVSSGDMLPKRTYDRFLARFGQPLRSLYGSTEAASIAMDTRPAETIVFGGLGRPLRNVTIEIRNADDIPLPPGREGDIWVSSPTLPPAGYDNRPALTEQVFRGGFYRTGDTGMMDADGRLTMTGRKQSFVDIAGYKVDLLEVEEILHECPGVREAAAVGVTIANLGTLIKAVVVAEPGVRERDIRGFCRERLAFVKVPRLIEMRDALPRSSTGKVLKTELGDVSVYLDNIRDDATAKLLRQLREAPAREGQTIGVAARRLTALRRLVRTQAASVLKLRAEEVSWDRGFADLGMDSFAALELRVRLEYLLERELPETLTFDHPTVAQVSVYLQRLFDMAASEAATAKRT